MTLPIKKKEFIKTERLTIKPYGEDDVDALVSLLTNTEITKTFMVPDFNSLSEAKNLVKKLIAFSQLDDKKHLEYGIYLDGKLIGFINDCGIEEDEIEIGYVICPDYQGRGYATEAVKAILLELKEMGFHKVRAGYFEKNKKSLRVLEKCGMKHNGIKEEEEYRGRVFLAYYCEISFQ